MEMTLPKHGTERAEQLQFLRFLAFLNVYIAHAEVWVFFRYPASHCSAAAVSFFFMLSGLVTGLSLYGKEISLSLKDQGRYMWRKVRKLYPLYFLTTVFCFGFYILPGIVSAGNWQALKEHILPMTANLLLIQTWFPADISYNPVAWYLATSMFLYLFSLPGMYVLNRVMKRRLPVVWLGGIFLALMVVITAWCRLTWPYDMDYLQYHLPAARVFEFLMGMVLACGVKWLKPRLEELRPGKWIFTVLELGALAFWVFCLRRPGNYWMNRIISWIIPNTVVLVVFTLGMGWVSDLFRRKPLVRLGDLSFPCYLIHNILVVQYVIRNPAPATPVQQAVPFFLCLLLTLLMAAQLTPKRKN